MLVPLKELDDNYPGDSLPYPITTKKELDEEVEAKTDE